MVTLPLWFATEHIQPTNPKYSSEHESGTALAFSTSRKLFKFVSANLAGEWKLQMADDRDGLVLVAADLDRLAITSLTLNPEKDGRGGEHIETSDLSGPCRFTGQ
jgi:hypothetical protein